MNELKKSNINKLAMAHIATNSEETFEAAYRNLLAEYQPKLKYWSTTTSLAGSHDMQALFDDAFMRSLNAFGANGGDFVKLFHRSLHNGFKSLLRKLEVRRRFEQYEMDSGDEDAAMFEIASEFNLENEITAKKKADQRQLIDSLLSGADATTTAIVEAALADTSLGRKLKPTAIGKQLGIHHSIVSRKIERLAAKFDARQYGEYSEYLEAL